jgi:hypothetical protein
MSAHFARDEEGGWNRKIRRATEPAKYAPSKDAAARPRQPDDFRRRASRKLGGQSEGSRPHRVAARRNFRYP